MTTNAERSLLLKLFAWTVVAVALLFLPVSRKLARRREGAVVARAVGP